MNTSYLALLRGINVGGKNMIKMADLKFALEAEGLQDVKTYIQSGNVLFRSKTKDTQALAVQMQAAILKHFGITVGVAVFSKDEWQKVITGASATWGQAKTWKHNLLIMLSPYDMREVVAAIGELKPDIEAIDAGEGVLYQSISLKLFGRTTGGKLASNPVYKQMTIRNYNTATKLLALLSDQ